MDLKVIDNFYEEIDFNYMLTASMLNSYSSTWQPNGLNFYSKANAYLCHETKVFLNTDKPFLLFLNTFTFKTGIKVKKCKSFFRKIYASDLEHIFKYGLPPHKDDCEFDVAGVVYYNTFGLDDGTALYTGNENYQIEPDIIIGAKPNRCVFYDPQITHSPLQSKKTEIRIIQPFFITYE